MSHNPRDIVLFAVLCTGVFWAMHLLSASVVTIPERPWMVLAMTSAGLAVIGVISIIGLFANAETRGEHD